MLRQWVEQARARDKRAIGSQLRGGRKTGVVPRACRACSAAATCRRVARATKHLGQLACVAAAAAAGKPCRPGACFVARTHCYSRIHFRPRSRCRLPGCSAWVRVAMRACVCLYVYLSVCRPAKCAALLPAPAPRFHARFDRRGEGVNEGGRECVQAVGREGKGREGTGVRDASITEQTPVP